MSYDAELNAAMKSSPAVAQRLHSIAQHPDVPDRQVARTYALALGRWLVGDRSSLPLPPSLALGIEGARKVDQHVRKYQPFARTFAAAVTASPQACAPGEVTEWLSEDEPDSGREQ